MKRSKSFSLALLIGLIAATTVGYSGPSFGQGTTEVESSAESTKEQESEQGTETVEAEQGTEAVEAEQGTETVEAETETETVEAEGAGEASAEEESAEEESAEPTLTADQRVQRKLLIQADAAYLAGDYDTAQSLYRQAKDQTWLLPHQFSNLPSEPFDDETLLRPGAAVYWREAQAGMSNQRLSQVMSALALLTDEYPAFIPGHVQYAAVLQENEQDGAASNVLEQALTLYPGNADLLLAQIDLKMAQGQWLEAAIASRQFVALNGDHPQAEVQTALATENLEQFQHETRQRIRDGAIANVFTGILGYAFTGSIFGPFTAANSTIMLLQGENAVGNQFATQIQQQLPMLQSPEALGYVRRLGYRLSEATGRRDLDYEFFVILDPNLNAFALPGGKIFVNAGAILETHSEAELAGLLAHELSHSVLSHGFQIATSSNLSSSVAQYLPYGGLINNIFLSGYSRTMERQADIVGTQILASSGYAADGVYNVMVTLNEQAAGRNGPTWLSSHPNPADRVDYLKALVERGGFNRYAYEGITSHEEIQAIVARELAAYEAEQAERNGAINPTETEAPETEAPETKSSEPEAEQVLEPEPQQ